MKEILDISSDALAVLTSFFFILWIAIIALAKWMAKRDIERDNKKNNNSQL